MVRGRKRETTFCKLATWISPLRVGGSSWHTISWHLHREWASVRARNEIAQSYVSLSAPSQSPGIARALDVSDMGRERSWQWSSILPHDCTWLIGHTVVIDPVLSFSRPYREECKRASYIQSRIFTGKQQRFNILPVYSLNRNSKSDYDVRERSKSTTDACPLNKKLECEPRCYRIQRHLWQPDNWEFQTNNCQSIDW